MNRKPKKAKCVWNSKFDIRKKKKKTTLKRTCPGKCGEIGEKKKKASSIPQEQSERREKGEETNQTRNSKLLFNFFFTEKLLTKLILALTSAQNL